MVTDLFRQTPGAILELSRNGAIEYRLDTKTDSSLAVFDNYRREFEHFSQAIMGGTPHSPSAQEVLADAIVLEALKQNSSSFSVTTPGDFLKSQA